MASGFSGAGSGSLIGGVWGNLGFTFTGSSTLGDFIREAQLDDFLYSWGGPKPKLRPVRITASQELPGRTHYDPSPATVPMGDKDIGGPVLAAVIAAARAEVPAVVFGRDPDFVNEGQPPVVFTRVPVLLPGQTDPGREEQETPRTQPTEDVEMAIDWGGAFSAGIDLLQGQNIGGGLPPAQFAGPAAFVATPTGGTPAKVTVNTRTGKVTPCRRRRRKPLLTDADFAALAKVASLPNNANVRTALAQAIRR